MIITFFNTKCNYLQFVYNQLHTRSVTDHMHLHPYHIVLLILCTYNKLIDGPRTPRLGESYHMPPVPLTSLATSNRLNLCFFLSTGAQFNMTHLICIQYILKLDCNIHF